MRAFFLVPVIGIIAACDPAIPDSGAGVGFNTPEYQAQREAALTGQTVNGDALIPPAAVSAEALPPASPVPGPNAPLSEPGTQVATTQPLSPGQNAALATGAVGSEDIARETAAALAAAGANSGVAPIDASPANPSPQQLSNPGISDEQDFTAVAARQSIESDAERIARNRASYQVVAPTAVPQRDGAGGPNIVQYALSTSHPVGTKVFSRAGFNLQAKSARNCAGFASPDQAQLAFLSSGGPQRDRQALDPDGDGYACAWNPEPFRRAVSN